MENLLESYFMQIDRTYNRLKSLEEFMGCAACCRPSIMTADYHGTLDGALLRVEASRGDPLASSLKRCTDAGTRRRLSI